MSLSHAPSHTERRVWFILIRHSFRTVALSVARGTGTYRTSWLPHSPSHKNRPSQAVEKVRKARAVREQTAEEARQSTRSGTCVTPNALAAPQSPVTPKLGRENASSSSHRASPRREPGGGDELLSGGREGGNLAVLQRPQPLQVLLCRCGWADTSLRREDSSLEVPRAGDLGWDGSRARAVRPLGGPVDVESFLSLITAAEADVERNRALQLASEL